MSDGREWLKPSELARREGVTRQTVWAWSRKGYVDIERHEGRRPRMRLAHEASSMIAPQTRRPPPRRDELVLLVVDFEERAMIDVSHLGSAEQELRPGVHKVRRPGLLVIQR
jgi:hypothetical protein